MISWHYSTLYHVAINEASLIVVKGAQLLDATIVASLAILLSSSRATNIHKMLGPKGRVVVTKKVAIRAMVIVMVMFVGRPMVEPMPWMPMSSRVMRLVSPKGISQNYLVIIFIGLMRLSQKTEFRNCSL